MTGPIHTYGPTCLLTDDDPDLSTWFSSATPPRVRPQFFYTSALPIDDPLTSLPPPSGGQGSVNDKAPPQPFSAKDHVALEEAWTELRENTGRKLAARAIRSREGTSARNSVVSVPEAAQRRRAGIHDDASPFGSQQNSPGVSTSDLENRPLRVAKVRSEHRASSAGLRPRTAQDDEVDDGSQSPNAVLRKKGRSSFSHNAKGVRQQTISSLVGEDAGLEEPESGSGRATPRDTSISGSPFIRAPISSNVPFGRSAESGSFKGGEEAPAEQGPTSHPFGPRTGIHQNAPLEDSQTEIEEHVEDEDIHERVPVGVSRLHLVELPNLKVLSLLFFFSFSWGMKCTDSLIDEANILEPPP